MDRVADGYAGYRGGGPIGLFAVRLSRSLLSPAQLACEAAPLGINWHGAGQTAIRTRGGRQALLGIP